MKFDYCIGNPPYQMVLQGDNGFTPSVFNDFMDVAYTVADKVELITPAKFLFNAGNTPPEWNEKMLHDKHFKVLKYEPDSAKVFPRPVTINGGVAIHYRDITQDFGCIGTFAHYPELQSIIEKLKNLSLEESLASQIYVQNKYNLEVLLREHPECQTELSSNGKDRRLRNNAFEKVSIFKEDPFENALKVIGLINKKRVFRFIDQRYIEMTHENIGTYKVLIAAADGAAGQIGKPIPARIVGAPYIAEPYLGYTQTFSGIGRFETLSEAENCVKYIKTKMCRTALGILKVTQTISKDTWRYVPLQDFTNNSDIDWSKSIHEIDLQLYKKYALTKEEIEFIESHVKEMD